MDKLRPRYVIGLLVLVLTALLVIAMRRGQHQLFTIASRLSGSNVQAYAWQSDREIVMVSKPEEQALAFPQAFRKDLKTDLQYPLSDLTLKLEAWSTESIAGPYVSPDGKRLAFQGFNNEASVQLINMGMERSHYYSPFGRQLGFDRIPVARMLSFGCVTELDGSHDVAWEDIDGLGGIWMPDSHSWLSLKQTQTVESVKCSLYSITGTGLSRKDIKIPIGIRALLGVRSDDRVIATDFSPFSGTPRNNVDFYEMDIRARPASARKFTVRLSRGAELIDLALSPRGDRLAWYFASARPNSKIRELLARWFPSLSRRLYGSVEECEARLCVSRVDGRDMHEIGSHVVGPASSPSPRLLSELRWSPDGKQLSFLYRQGVWTIPAE